MTKRTWILLMSISFVLGLAACGKSAPPVEDDPTAGTEAGSGQDGSGSGDTGSGSGETGPDVHESTPGENLQDVFFEFDRYELRAEARRILQEDARYLRDHPDVHVLLEGHCDERGTSEYNLALGQRRADAVRDYLVSLGIDPGRLSTISYGEERPFALGSSEAAWAQNRRVHFRPQPE